jgi:Xaa-Pro aminopeptidase
MPRDLTRIDWIQNTLREENLDALVCSLPANVLLLTGYWPVVGTSIAIVFRDLPTILIIPEDESNLVNQGWAEEVWTFHPGSLDNLDSVEKTVRGTFSMAVQAVSAHCKRVGFENGGMVEPASYAAMHLYGPDILTLLGEMFPDAALVPASESLGRLCSVKTPAEIARIREAGRIASAAFQAGLSHIEAGMIERCVAESFHSKLCEGKPIPPAARIGGFTWCMSGPNSANASGAYACSTERILAPGDLVLIHCNSYVDGYWTDITRTYCLSPRDERSRTMAKAVLAARTAALETIRPGIPGSAVDAAARNVLRDYGWEEEFKHSTGHGVGFGAISAQARPRLHPKSDDVLKAGMVFNVEPALYFKGYGGFRQCDMVALTENGAEVLTPFHDSIAELMLP